MSASTTERALTQVLKSGRTKRRLRMTDLRSMLLRDQIIYLRNYQALVAREARHQLESRLALSMRSLPAHVSYEKLQRQSTEIVDCLQKFGIAVINDFANTQLSEQILAEIQRLDRCNMMTEGRTTGANEQNQYRSDKVAWIAGTEPCCHSIGALVNTMDSLIGMVKQKIAEYDIQGRTQAMVACYPGTGTHYKRHIDNPNQDGRCLTCVYYANKNWNAKEHGGVLKIYPEGTTKVASVEPLMNRLLLFWSDKRNPHEVLPAYKTRYAVTVWYLDANERNRATQQNSTQEKTTDK